MNEKDNEYYNAIINKVGPDVLECFKLQKQIFKSHAPKDMCEGMVLGYLLGKGFNYEESAIGVYQFHRTIDELIKKDPTLEHLLPEGGVLTMNSRDGISVEKVK